MNEKEKEHWFNLGKQSEINQRVLINTKEFWLGVLIASIITALLF